MARKRPFTGRLLKSIHLGDAKVSKLHEAFGYGPDEDDLANHILKELAGRYSDLDCFFGLQSESPNIWEQRAKALIAREFGISASDSEWWRRLTIYMTQK